MPIRLIRVPRKVVAPDPPAEAPVLEEAGALPHPRGWTYGEAILLRKQDFSEEQGKVKFLLHKVKSNVWYKVRWFDDDLQRVGLTSQVDYEFDCKIDSTTEKNYIMAVLSEEVVAPSAELLAFVHRVLPDVQTSAT